MTRPICGMLSLTVLLLAGCGYESRTPVPARPSADGGPGTPDTAAPRVGTLAPEIEGEDIDGVVFRLSDYRGKVVVLDFWGHW